MINPKYIEKTKTYLNSAGKIGIKIAKYGTVFTSGVLVGTICGVVLFFKISDGEL